MSYVDTLINDLGGTLGKASKILGVPKSTIQGWVESGSIPDKRKPNILRKAREHGIILGPENLFPHEEAA